MSRICAQNSAHDYAGQNACCYRREYGVVLSCAVGARENMGASAHECGYEHADGGAEEYAYDRAQKRVSSVAHNRTPLLSAPRQGRAYRFAFPATPKAIPAFAQNKICFVCADARLPSRVTLYTRASVFRRTISATPTRSALSLGFAQITVFCRLSLRPIITPAPMPGTAPVAVMNKSNASRLSYSK